MNILLVEPDEALAGQIVAAFRAAGYPPLLTATDSDAAVDLLNERGLADLLITDVFIQPADGFSLRETLQPFMPGMRTIFLSAYDLSDHAERLSGSSLLYKPLDLAALVESVRALLPLPAPVPAPRQAGVPVVARVAAPVHEVKAEEPAPPQSDAVEDESHQAVQPKQVAHAAEAPAAAPAPVPVPTAKAVLSPLSASRSVSASALARAAAVKGVKVGMPSPRVKAVPTVAKASATSSPRAVPVASAKPAAVKAESAEGDGQRPLLYGHYRVEREIRTSGTETVYLAHQLTVSREVELYVLRPDASPEQRQAFLANASVKANVRHPFIIAVYEAGEANQSMYYACEHVNGRSLAEIQRSGDRLAPHVALRAIKCASEALAYFHQYKFACAPLTPEDVVIGPKDQPRVRNLAVVSGGDERPVAERIAVFAGQIEAVLGEEGGETALKGARTLIANMQGSEEPVLRDWLSVAARARELEPQVVPADAYKLNAQDRAAIMAVEEAKRRQRRALMVSCAGSFLLLTAILATVYILFFRKPQAKNFEVMLEIPAGEFVYQDGEKVNLPTFWIDQYEVTVGQYAQFLDYLKNHPEEAQKFDHPDQPKGKSHVPLDWEDRDLPGGKFEGYYSRARKYASYKNAAYDLNSPVMNVDWYDAYAYAKWKGHRLPTEQEWEKAARGTDGFKYPWGEEPNPSKANTGKDFTADPKAKAEVDGFKRWSPVDAMKGDKSPYGVMGMAGNVSEWTASMDVGPRVSDPVPVIRGGNFQNEDHTLTRRIMLRLPLEQDLALGFRTASDAPPAPAK